MAAGDAHWLRASGCEGDAQRHGGIRHVEVHQARAMLEVGGQRERLGEQVARVLGMVLGSASCLVLRSMR